MINFDNDTEKQMWFEIVKVCIDDGTTLAALVAADEVIEAFRKRQKIPQTFSVFLNAIGYNRIDTIKAVRQLTGVDLQRAKILTEGLPKLLATNLTQEEVDQHVSLLVAAGATISVK